MLDETPVVEAERDVNREVHFVWPVLPFIRRGGADFSCSDLRL